MKIKGREVNFEFEFPGLTGTEIYISDSIFKRLEESAIVIPGDEKINFIIYGFWDLAAQISQKELDIRSCQDVPGHLGFYSSCFKCDEYCGNCPLSNCSERTCESKLPKFEVIKL